MTTLETWKTFEPDSYYKSFLDKGKRPDGRSLTEVRPTVIRTGSITTAEGSATVRLGNTSVVCGIKAEIAVPELRNPDSGFVVPNIELYPCCSPMFKAGPPGEKAISASHFLKSTITSSELIDLKDLCIVSNKYAWCLFCDIVCLDYDGNLGDASLIALRAALENVKLPQVTYDEDTEQLSVTEEKSLPLKLKNKPVASTFIIYSDRIQMIDPTIEDEQQGSGEVTLVLREDLSVCTTHKPGGTFVTPEQLQNFIKLAQERVPAVNETISKALQHSTTNGVH